MRMPLWGCVAGASLSIAVAAAAGCDGVAGETELTVFEQVVAADAWVEDARYSIGTITGCDDCVEVVMHRYASTKTEAVNVAIELYYDVAPSGGSYADGDHVCTMWHNAVEVFPDGGDPLRRSIVDVTPMIHGDCFGRQPSSTQALEIVDRDEDDQPAFAVSWTLEAVDEPWPGFVTDGGARHGAPLRPCSPDAYAPGRAYCMPSCDVGGPNGCRYAYTRPD